MSSDDIKEEKGRDPTANALAQTASYGEGNVQDIDDPAVRDFYGSCLSDSYRLKSELVSKQLTEIGMGKYQWCLFVVTGFGWITDNFWSQGISTVQPAMAMEFADITKRSYSSVAYYVGLILGASFWGISADFIGRKPAFNATILIGGIFGCAVAGAQNFIAFSALWAVIGTAAGGNVPVDSMIFLEFVPGSHQWLLTALSAWWNFGQVIVSLIGWVFLANYSCPSGSDYTTCSRRDNMGWRYTMITLGALALAFAIIRIFVFKMPESPRYLLSKGRDAEAVDAVNYIARFNGKPETLTLAMLHDIDVSLGMATTPTPTDADVKTQKLSRRDIMRENLKDYKGVNYKSLFATPKFALHTSLIWLIWLTIGIAYPLYFGFLPSYLETKFSAATSLDITYRNYCIVSATGVLGPLAAAFLVEPRRLTVGGGRRSMMGLSALLTGVFLFAYTAAATETQDLAFQCVTGILGNFEYAVMYAFTPESFPAPLRGTATGTAATLLRVGGLVAAVVSANVGFSTVPIYVSAALWVGVGVVCVGLPFETAGHAAV
ncbi:major facilitator superfamily transporter [Diplodia corticola]|uniref:Major facilitator superfamily transporter n=1 Tax=Diplodia corticola TaxID=236234 RepID=A0A1J9QLY9_9PEZI|nr:major facilitator superfamily transporter [Diplodia corticola]OJD29074.1 major facilitator superfamily transporter [Diplodia corticola]